MSSRQTAGTRGTWGGVGRVSSCGGVSAFPSLSLSHPSLLQSTSLLHPSSQQGPHVPSSALAHVSKVWLLAGAFLEEALALSTAPWGALDPAGTGQGRPLRSSPLLCALPCPKPLLGLSSAHLWLPAMGVVTGWSPSECLPLGTSSTISVCRGASMAQGPPPGVLAHTPTPSEVCRAGAPLITPALGPTAQPPTGGLSHRAPPRGSLRTNVHMPLCLLPPGDLPLGEQSSDT